MPKPAPSGLAHAVAAYVLWGFLPLYLLLVKTVPAFEFVGWRAIWTVPLCVVIVAVRRQGPELMTALRDRRTMMILCATALLIGANWYIYVVAVQHGYVLAGSLGYYISPLLTVVMGTVVLGERLNRRQWLAVALSTAGIAVLLSDAVSTLYISLALAGTFALYSLLRKQVAVGALPGLTIEAGLLLPPAIVIAIYYSLTPAGSSFGGDIGLSIAIIFGGVVTAVPLLLFATAARRLDFTTLGFVQFLGPSILFVLGLTVFGEPINTAQMWCFAFIWSALAVFVYDLWRKPRMSA